MHTHIFAKCKDLCGQSIKSLFLKNTMIISNASNGVMIIANKHD